MGKVYKEYLEEQQWHCPDCEKKFTTKRDKTQAKCFACGKTLSMSEALYPTTIGNPIAAKYLGHQYDVPQGSHDAGPKTTGDTEKVQGIGNTLGPELWRVQDSWQKWYTMASEVAPDAMKSTFDSANDTIMGILEDLMEQCKKIY